MTPKSSNQRTCSSWHSRMRKPPEMVASLRSTIIYSIAGLVTSFLTPSPQATSEFLSPDIHPRSSLRVFVFTWLLTHDLNSLSSASDGINAVNQSNVALKGIIGIGAMSKIAGYAGKQDNATHYSNISQQYIQEWTGLATTQNFISLSYGSSGSGLIYNMYADKLLQTNLIPSSVSIHITIIPSSSLMSLLSGVSVAD